MHQQIDSGQSMALLMGCRVACDAARTGPVTDIDALQTVLAMTAAEGVETPLDFFRIVAAASGPLHIDIDALGRMRGVSMADLSPGSLQAAAGIAPVRLLLAQELSAPLTSRRVAGMVLRALVLAPLIIGGGWFAALLMGCTPRRLWRFTAERYVVTTGRAELDAVPLSPGERIALLVVSPWVALFWLIAQVILLASWLLLPLALVLGRPLLRLGLSDKLQMTASARPTLARWLPRWVNAATRRSQPRLASLLRASS